MPRPVHRLAILILMIAQAVAGGAVAQVHFDKFERALDCTQDPCAQVLPGATSFVAEEGRPWVRGLDAAGEPVGWVALSTDVVDIKAYSGKPVVTLLGLDPTGRIAGARVIHHSEPILLVGIPEKKLHDFVDAHVGLQADAPVRVGGDAQDAFTVDVISGATVTVLAESRTIMETAQRMGEEVGVVARAPRVAGHFVQEGAPLSWAQLVERGVLGRLTVSQEEMGQRPSAEGTPFIDVYFGVVDSAPVGRALLGDAEWTNATATLASGEHLVVMLGNGSSSFKGSGFVRGGIFDRVRLEQGVRQVVFRDLDYRNIGQPLAAGAPSFKEGALFVARDNRLDPGMSYQLTFLGSAFTYAGGIERRFHSFSAQHRVPKSVYVLDGPDPESLVWRRAWQMKRVEAGLLIAYLLLVTGVFVARRWTAGTLPRLKKLHLGFLLVTFFGLGLGLRLQPSVTQLLTLSDGLLHSWRWGLFLSDPLLFITWIFIAITTILWGRGVFCGWACPYGALSELLFKVGRLLKLPEYELPDSIHNKARFVRYAVFGVLLTAFLLSPELGERMAEIEPFKSTFLVPAWTRHGVIFGWWALLLGASLVQFRPFCRYICPLGAALAVPSSGRLSSPYRRDFCATGCRICPRGCEPRAIRKDGSIDPRECLNCWECEATYHDDQRCPPLVKIRRVAEREAREAAGTGATSAKGTTGAAGGTTDGAGGTTGGAGKGVSPTLGLLLLALTVPGAAQARDLVIGKDALSAQATIDLAMAGDRVLVPPGIWPGPVDVNKAITVQGDGGTLDGGSVGTVVRLTAPGARLLGVKVAHSGDDRAGPDACVYVAETAIGASILDSELTACTFGIWIHKGREVRVEGNHVVGRSDLGHRSNRGNGIHLFDSTGLRIVGNHVEGGRDGIYVSATEDSLIADNEARDLRYGIHYMYSWSNTVRGNHISGCTAGIAIMSSHHIVVEGNDSTGNQAHGILIRDVQDSRIASNVVENNGEGLFFFSSVDNVIVDNRIAHNEIGARVWAGTERNVVRGNELLGNRRQVFFVAAADQEWGDEEDGNYWSDYLGWDQDLDGRGDRIHRVDSTTAALLHRYPAAALLLSSPALEVILRVQQLVPSLSVPTIVERAPRMAPRDLRKGLP